MEKGNRRKKQSIRFKVTALLLSMVLLTMLTAAGVSFYSLNRMKQITMEGSAQLGQTAAEDAEKALEELAEENLQTLAEERAAYIEEKYSAVEAYVLGIAAQAQDIYEHPDKYPEREVALPVPGSSELAAQLLWSKRLEAEGLSQSGIPGYTEELLKLGNLQDLLVQYNAHNDMVSSTYLATETGWMLQADYIAYSKYEEAAAGEGQGLPIPYEADSREWYQKAKEVQGGQVIYTDVIRDIHGEGDCIVCASPVRVDGRVVAVAGVGSYLNTVKRAVLNTDVGEEGYAFLVNENGQVMVSGRMEGETAAYAEKDADLRKSMNEQLSEAAFLMLEGRTGSQKLTLDGQEVYLAYAPLKRLGWSFVTVLNVEEIVEPARKSQELILALTEQVSGTQNTTIRGMLLYFCLMMAALSVSISLAGTLFSRKLTKPIHRLTEEVARMDGGNLDYRIQIYTGDEVEELGRAFNKMTAQVQEHIHNLAAVTAEKERIRTEIQVASRLQADMLPEAEGAFADRREFTLYATMDPAKGVGGDFYDFFLLDENHLALVMADVSGKGVPAALFMVVSRTLIRSRLGGCLNGRTDMGQALAEAVEAVNASLCDNNKNDMFVTAWIGILDLYHGTVAYVNAGHCRPLIRRADGEAVYDRAVSGFVLAGLEESAYRPFRLELEEGDTLFLYTDGVTEATNTEKELYGEQRLQQAVSGFMKENPQMLLERIKEDVDAFWKGAEQFDDITMLALTWQGRGRQELTGKPEQERMPDFASFVEAELKGQAVSPKSISVLLVSTDELLSNICRYSGATGVTVGVEVRRTDCGKTVSLFFEDDGTPFNPLDMPEPDVEEPLDRRKIGGLGIYMVRKRSDRMEYEYREGHNCLTITLRDAG